MIEGPLVDIVLILRISSRTNKAAEKVSADLTKVYKPVIISFLKNNGS